MAKKFDATCRDVVTWNRNTLLLELMDEESKQLLRQIRDLQLEQLELTRKIYSGIPPWLNWRFSLRQILIAVTVVAVVLGVLVIANR